MRLLDKLNIINNPQFDLRYFTLNDKYVISEFVDGKYTKMEEAVLEDRTPFVLSFKVDKGDSKFTHKDVPISSYTNRLVNIYKVVI